MGIAGEVSYMRKLAYLVTTLLLFLLCVHSVTGYSNASVMNQVVLTVTDPSNGLVSLVPFQDKVLIRQGEKAEGLRITNNLQSPIYYSLEYDHDHLFLELPDEYTLYPAEVTVIMLSAADNSPTGDGELSVVLQADFEGGSCRIRTDVAVFVYDGDLQLRLGDGGLATSWNGGDAPSGTVILYRYREALEDQWSDWGRVDEDSQDPSIPGYYEYKAVFGETESQVISNYVEPPLGSSEDVGPHADFAEIDTVSLTEN